MVGLTKRYSSTSGSTTYLTDLEGKSRAVGCAFFFIGSVSQNVVLDLESLIELVMLRIVGVARMSLSEHRVSQNPVIYGHVHH
jgi:hypothetical protein